MYLLAPVASPAQRPTLVGRAITPLGVPLDGVHVSVETTAIATSSRPDGSFRVTVPATAGVLLARRLGFTPTRVPFDLRAARDTLVIVLQPAAIELRGIRSTGGADGDWAHVATRSNVRELPALGEPDLLRVLPFLPNVTQPDDVRGAIHLAGAAADETQMFLDDHPLQWPMHLTGVVGAFNVAALEQAVLTMHRLPIEVGGPAGGTIALTPRRVDSSSVDGVLTMLSSSLTIARHRAFDRVDVLASGRLTYADQVIRHLLGSVKAGQSGLRIPSFRDGLLRVSPSEYRCWNWSGTAFATHDALPAYQAQKPTSWGEAMVGVRVAPTCGSWQPSLSASYDQAWVNASDPRQVDFIDVLQRSFRAVTTARRPWNRSMLSTGIELVVRKNEHSWNGGNARAAFSPIVPLTYASTREQSRPTAFAELTGPAGGLIASLGVRSRLSGPQVVAPRVSVERRVSQSVRFTLSGERRTQDDVALAGFASGSVAQPNYLLDVVRVSDDAGAEFEWRPDPFSRGQLAMTLSPYARRFRQRPIVEAASEASSFPTFRFVDATARGVGASLDWRAVGGGGAQISYGFARAREEDAGRTVPSDWDIPHSVVAFGRIPVGAQLDLSASVQWRSGVPITPVDANVLAPSGLTGDPTRYESRYLYKERNGERMVAFRRIDLAVTRRWTGWGASWSASAQVINAAKTENALAYDWRQYYAPFRGNESVSAKRGLPLLPSIGITASW